MTRVGKEWAFRILRRISSRKIKVRAFIISFYIDKSKSYLERCHYSVLSTMIPTYFLDIWGLPPDGNQEKENLMIEKKHIFDVPIAVLDYIYEYRFNRIMLDYEQNDDIEEFTETLTIFDQIIRYIINAQTNRLPIVNFDIFDFDNYKSISNSIENNEEAV